MDLQYQDKEKYPNRFIVKPWKVYRISTLAKGPKRSFSQAVDLEKFHIGEQPLPDRKRKFHLTLFGGKKFWIEYYILENCRPSQLIVGIFSPHMENASTYQKLRSNDNFDIVFTKSLDTISAHTGKQTLRRVLCLFTWRTFVACFGLPKNWISAVRVLFTMDLFVLFIRRMWSWKFAILKTGSYSHSIFTGFRIVLSYCPGSHASVICQAWNTIWWNYSEETCGNPNYWSLFSDPNSMSSRGVLCILARSSQKCWYCETLWIPNFIVSDSGLRRCLRFSCGMYLFSLIWH